MKKCSQCGKPAVVEYEGGLLLCVSCNHTYTQDMQTQMNSLMIQANYLHDEMDSIYGIRTGGRYTIPTPFINQGSINNLQVEKSMIGILNTGAINDINGSITQISKAGNEKLSSALKNFTQEVIDSQELEDRIKKRRSI